MKKSSILILCLIISLGILLFFKCKPKAPTEPSKIDSIKTEIIKTEDSINVLTIHYEKNCSIIINQSFSADSLFFTNYLERFRLYHDSGTTKNR